MKRYQNRLFLCSLLLWSLLTGCATPKSNSLDFLIGTWKVQDKNQFEVWEKTTGGSLIGYSYKMEGNQQQKTETLTIRKVDDHWQLEATVPTQNDGATIPFVLNIVVKDRFSFENLNHDFPKKIQYQVLSKTQIKVTVLGEDGEGFSYIQEKQE